MLADALTSVLAIAGLLAAWAYGWTWLDPVIGVVGALVIARWSWGLIKDTGSTLTGGEYYQIRGTAAHVGEVLVEGLLLALVAEALDRRLDLALQVAGAPARGRQEGRVHPGAGS